MLDTVVVTIKSPRKLNQKPEIMKETNLNAAEIEAYRRAMGLTLEELGQQINANPRTIRAWEAGKQKALPIYTTAITALYNQHRAQAEALAEAGGAVEISRGDHARGWKLSVFTRAKDLNPDLTAQLTSEEGRVL